ncbi:MAG: ABC transporter ATP-binding protein [Phycisphaerae bacterium]|jgi:oligopeptide/dipeptide ABC transporter ATP-binding protein|nr:ABC transporter ATP-binding protein [Phycisphaerae bacterium]
MDDEKNNLLLSVKDLKTHFVTDEGLGVAVDDVSFDVGRGQTLALVGESGCGKTVTALSVLRLIPQPPGRIVSGQVMFNGQDLLGLSDEEIRGVRGNDISMIFQEPMTSLNPVFTIGRQIAEAVLLHQATTKGEARDRAVEMLDKVGIPAAEWRVDEYPHQMSGGMRQRVMIAMALVSNPSLLIADEPTTALDVTIQAQILDLLRRLQRETSMSILLITHDLGVVAEMADTVAVMYAGNIVEKASVKELFANSIHPYTVGLFKSLPSLGLSSQAGPRSQLDVIPGTVPDATRIPPGCPFHPRCPLADNTECPTRKPPLDENRPGHFSACWHWDRVGEITESRTQEQQ